MRSRWECKQPDLSPRSSNLQQFLKLSICDRRATFTLESCLSQWSDESLFWNQPCGPVWAFQSSDHSRVCGQRLMVSPVFRFIILNVDGRGGVIYIYIKKKKKERKLNHVHVCLSRDSLMLQSDKQCSPNTTTDSRASKSQSYRTTKRFFYWG